MPFWTRKYGSEIPCIVSNGSEIINQLREETLLLLIPDNQFIGLVEDYNGQYSFIMGLSEIFLEWFHPCLS